MSKIYSVISWIEYEKKFYNLGARFMRLLFLFILGPDKQKILA